MVPICTGCGYSVMTELEPDRFTCCVCGATESADDLDWTDDEDGDADDDDPIGD